MNFQKIEKQFRKLFNIRGVPLDVHKKDNYLMIDAVLKIDGLYDHVMMQITIFEYGLINFYFYFGVIEVTEHMINLLNKFNDEALFLRAIVTNGDFGLIYATTAWTEKGAFNALKFVIKDLVDENNRATTKEIIRYLKS